MSSGLKKTLIAIACAGLALAVASTRRPSHKVSLTAAQKVVDAKIISVVAETDLSGTEVDGVVRPGMTASLSPKINSTVVAVLVRVGDSIKTGQALVTLEAKDLVASEHQAKAALGASEANVRSAQTSALLQDKATKAEILAAQAAVQQAKHALKIVRDGSRKQNRVQADLAAQQAKAQMNLSLTELNRTRLLYDQGAVSKQLLDQAENTERVRRTEWESMQQQASLIDEGNRKEDVRLAEEKLRQAESMLAASRAKRLSVRMSVEQASAATMHAKQARATLDAAQTMVNYSVIKSPFNGVVAQRFVDPGDQIGPGSETIRVEDRSGWRVEADVPEGDSTGLQINALVTVRVDGLGEKILSARIIEISPSRSTSTHTIHIKAALEPDRDLRSGQFARIMLPKVAPLPNIKLPSFAILESDGLARVWTLDRDGRAQLTLITVGQTTGDKITILSGISPGMRVIVSNLNNLTSGVQVREIR